MRTIRPQAYARDARPVVVPVSAADSGASAPRVDGYTHSERAMMARLIEWGNIMLRGSAFKDRPVLFDSDAGQRKPAWTGRQVETAKALHMLITELPEIRLTILLQVVYRAPDVAKWGDIPIPRQRRLTWEWARECNARITTASRERRIPPVYVQAGDMMRHRDRAVRLLILREREARALAETPKAGAILTGGRG